MLFDKHVFISYSHLDDQPMPPEEKGWISRFHQVLEALLSTRIGRKAKIWRDDKLRGNDDFAHEIIDQFPRTAALISILTPTYLNSKWCTKELQKFCEAAQNNGGIEYGNKTRVFKVIKTPIEPEVTVPPIMDKLLGYQFFINDNGAPLELDPVEKEFQRTVNRLAWDLAKLLKALEKEEYTSESPIVIPSRKPIIYLAECSSDKRLERQNLKDELVHHGYQVLPNRDLPREEDAYIQEVKNLVECCDLSVHVVGERYGLVPDGPTLRSATMLQNEVAANFAKEKMLKRVIWLPELSDQHDLDTNQLSFREALHQNAELQFGADLVTGGIEEFKHTTYSVLKTLEASHQNKSDNFCDQGSDDNEKLMIYLICDQKDRKDTIPIRKFFRSQGYDVKLPAVKGTASEIREAEKMMLSVCDAILLFFGSAGGAWKTTKECEFKKMRAYRGNRPLLANYTYLAAPISIEKEDLIDEEEPNLINGLSGFNELLLMPFIQTVKTNGTVQCAQ